MSIASLVMGIASQLQIMIVNCHILHASVLVHVCVCVPDCKWTWSSLSHSQLLSLFSKYRHATNRPCVALFIPIRWAIGWWYLSRPWNYLRGLFMAWPGSLAQHHLTRQAGLCARRINLNKEPLSSQSLGIFWNCFVQLLHKTYATQMALLTWP